jgi:hypothetical protein
MEYFWNWEVVVHYVHIGGIVDHHYLIFLGYIHNIKISEARGAMRVDARCWRSMRKSQDPHNLHVEIGDDKLSESYCTCKTGYIKPFSKAFLDYDSKSGKNETAILSGIFSKESDASLGCWAAILKM